jgi:hypothetical protein
MNVEIGAEAALFPEKEYISGIFIAVYETLTVRFMYKLYRHKLYREQIVSAQIVSAQFVSAQFVSDTNCIGHKLYRAQIVSGTNCIGHKLYLVTNWTSSGSKREILLGYKYLWVSTNFGVEYSRMM